MLLLSTRPGSMAAAMCAAHGGAKERKRMMRALKGYVAASLMHRYGTVRYGKAKLRKTSISSCGGRQGGGRSIIGCGALF